MTLITTTLLATGLLQTYAPGVMAEVVVNRIQYQHIAPSTLAHECLALVDCATLNRKVCMALTVDSQRLFGPFTVCDCSSSTDRARHIDKGLAAECDWSLTEKIQVPVGKFILPRDGPLAGVKVYACGWVRGIEGHVRE